MKRRKKGEKKPTGEGREIIICVWGGAARLFPVTLLVVRRHGKTSVLVRRCDRTRSDSFLLNSRNQELSITPD